MTDVLFLGGNIFFLMMGNGGESGIQKPAYQNDKAYQQHYFGHLSGGSFTHDFSGSIGPCGAVVGYARHFSMSGVILVAAGKICLCISPGSKNNPAVR
ncbi:hypothetical protein ACWA06_10025 [Serratia rhizosphaerae]|uniref:hypothetical protein n=1 Tax=unclassified Serratia (in: enterobacteria) TaxID=2647522 RepID=UPI00164D9850|nr:hypothetical protein [Serratia rubidaea]MCA4823795.1 hypothetical protein [Serratia rubidaea]QPT12340.1 hypothetical protein I6G37_17855 [Serratia rubidaea]